MLSQAESVLAQHKELHEVLDKIAAEWNKLTDELGRAKQLEDYRAAMGL